MANIVYTTGANRITAIDEVNTNLTYIGFAKIGSATSAAVWQIFRVQKTGSTTLIQYADGNENYDNVFDDRASLSYS